MSSMAVIRTLLLLVALCGIARADDMVVRAEYDRLSGELRQLVARSVWTGVERKFQALEVLDYPLTADDYWHGALAARELGNVYNAYLRLKKAAHLSSEREIVDWLWNLDNHYGIVDLISTGRRGTELSCAKMPFDPNQRKAVEAAIMAVQNTGNFSGMLPAGGYKFVGHEFKVEPGVSIRVELSPKQRKQGLVEPVIIFRENPGAVTIERPVPATVPDAASSESDAGIQEPQTTQETGSETPEAAQEE
jgi:hypothetical protein